MSSLKQDRPVKRRRVSSRSSMSEGEVNAAEEPKDDSVDSVCGGDAESDILKGDAEARNGSASSAHADEASKMDSETSNSDEARTEHNKPTAEKDNGTFEEVETEKPPVENGSMTGLAKDTIDADDTAETEHKTTEKVAEAGTNNNVKKSTHIEEADDIAKFGRSILSPITNKRSGKNSKENNKHSTSNQDQLTGFRLIDINLLVAFISKFPCPSCNEPCLGQSNSETTEVTENVMGLASVLVFVCGSCGARHTMKSSAKAGPSFEVNSRFSAAMFKIGNNDHKAKCFCSNMKMPESLSLKSWMNKSA